MKSFFSVISAFILGGCVLIIGVQNPVHSILILILVFLFGSVLLFMLQVEYFAILFMLVYIGAIVVLFLFIVMMLEIKVVNSIERFKDFFSIRNLIISVLMIQVLFFVSDSFFDLVYILDIIKEYNLYNILTEVNLYTNYGMLIQVTDHLKGLGGVLFTEYKLSIMIGALLLFLSMVGAIVMTVEPAVAQTIKVQDANFQALRNVNNVIKRGTIVLQK